MAAADYLNWCQLAFMMYARAQLTAGKTRGALRHRRNRKSFFLKNNGTGHWTGTMLLTNPEAGSDVATLTDLGGQKPDGTLCHHRQRDLISSGEHDLAENTHPSRSGAHLKARRRTAGIL